MGIRPTIAISGKISRRHISNKKINNEHKLIPSDTITEGIFILYMNNTTIQQELEKRVLVIDGAMGSMIQQYKLERKRFSW